MNDIKEAFEAAKSVDFETFKAMLYALPPAEDNYTNFSSIQSLFLIERYPFLLSKNRFSREKMFDFESVKQSLFESNVAAEAATEDDFYAIYWPPSANADDKSVHIYNELNIMPKGWCKAFGLELIEDVNNLLLASSDKDPYKNYMIEDIKEKYGTLRYYDGGVPYDVFDEESNLIMVYEFLSGNVCIECGKTKGVRLTSGWVSPYCEEHFGNAEDYEKALEPTRICRDMSEVALCYKFEKDEHTGKYASIPVFAEDMLGGIEAKLDGKKLQVRRLLEDVIEVMNCEGKWSYYDHSED